MRAVITLPSSVAEAATVGADALLSTPAIVRAFDRKRAVLTEESRVAEAAAVLANAAVGAMVGPLAAYSN